MTWADFFQKISYYFNDQTLFEEAITHPSFSGVSGKSVNYQRLEFLGDTVLALIVAEWLIKKYPHENEGQLSKRQAYLVSGQVLSDIALQLDLGKIIKLSNGEDANGGRNNRRNLENSLEAIIGAIYLDSGLNSCQIFIHNFWQAFVNSELNPPKDPTSELQEFVQAKFKQLPEYQISKIEGREHQPVFMAEVKVAGRDYVARGQSKKEAQKNVALVALEAIKK